MDSISLGAIIVPLFAVLVVAAIVVALSRVVLRRRDDDAPDNGSDGDEGDNNA